MYYSAHYKSPIGDILIICDGKNITELRIEGQKHTGGVPRGIAESSDAPLLREGRAWLDEYFGGGKPLPSRLPLAPAGSGFRQMIWRLILDIPYGFTESYGSIAKKAAALTGRDKMSAQAVGGAVGHNPIPIIIPCHRVIGADGSLTGYAGGIEAKRFLLKHERAAVNSPHSPKRRG